MYVRRSLLYWSSGLDHDWHIQSEIYKTSRMRIEDFDWHHVIIICFQKNSTSKHIIEASNYKPISFHHDERPPTPSPPLPAVFLRRHSLRNKLVAWWYRQAQPPRGVETTSGSSCRQYWIWIAPVGTITGTRRWLSRWFAFQFKAGIGRAAADSSTDESRSAKRDDSRGR